MTIFSENLGRGMVPLAHPGYDYGETP